MAGSYICRVEVAIRAYAPGDAADLADVFFRSVRQVALSAYTAAQVRACQEHPETAADGTYRVVLPAVVASRERVSQNEAFELDDLAPGRYVILAQYAGGNVSTYMDVSVASGQVVMVVLPDTCK